MIPNAKYLEPPDPRLSTPIYFGRRDVLVETGDYFVPPWQPGVAVVLSESGPKAFVNVCRHRQSIILFGRGHISNIRCPMHGWSWDLDGKSKGSPGFECGKDLLGLELEESGGWMYAPGSGFPQAIEENPSFEMTGYVPLESNTFEHGCSWLEYVDVSVDLNHVKYIHPGLRAWTDCSSPEVVYGDGWSVQSVPLKNNGNIPGLAKTWWETLVDRVPESVRESAHWAHVYPNVLVENYAGCFIGIAVVVPNGKDCVIHEEVWVCQDLAGDSELKTAFSEMYEEIEREDEILFMAQRHGREALMSMGLEDSGPYQDPTESGMKHFHQWLLNWDATPAPTTLATKSSASGDG